MTSRVASLLVISMATFAGCVADDKGDEDDVPVDGKDDSFVTVGSVRKARTRS